MKLISQKWTSPNTLEFNALWQNRKVCFRSSWCQKDNKPYESGGITIKSAAFPFMVYQGKLYTGKVGQRHDGLFADYYEELNNPTITVTKSESGRPKCVNMRNVALYEQQGRCFVFKLEDRKLVVVTTWKNDISDKLFEMLKERVEAAEYHYIHLNELKKI